MTFEHLHTIYSRLQMSRWSRFPKQIGHVTNQVILLKTYFDTTNRALDTFTCSMKWDCRVNVHKEVSLTCSPPSLNNNKHHAPCSSEWPNHVRMCFYEVLGIWNSRVPVRGWWERGLYIWIRNKTARMLMILLGAEIHKLVSLVAIPKMSINDYF